jgi:hypothetical protein
MPPSILSSHLVLSKLKAFLVKEHITSPLPLCLLRQASWTRAREGFRPMLSLTPGMLLTRASSFMRSLLKARGGRAKENEGR